jgi:hypothetical protein
MVGRVGDAGILQWLAVATFPQSEMTEGVQLVAAVGR